MTRLYKIQKDKRPGAGRVVIPEYALRAAHLHVGSSIRWIVRDGIATLQDAAKTPVLAAYSGPRAAEKETEFAQVIADQKHTIIYLRKVVAAYQLILEERLRPGPLNNVA